MENTKRDLSHLMQSLENKVYYVEPEQEFISCTGCVFHNLDSSEETDGCKVPDDAEEDFKETCYNQRIIWKEKKLINTKAAIEEPKFTVKQVLLAAGNYLREQPIFQDYDKIHVTALEQITEELVKQNDPDYRLYLQLKQKYDKS